MPVVNSVNPNAKPAASAIQRIKSVASLSNRPLRMSLYGRPKVGKTRLCATFPKPILIIGTEDGTESIGAVKDVDMVVIKHTDEVRDLVDHAISSKKWQTLALDNATQMQGMKLAELLGLDETPIQHARGAAMKVDNQEYSLQTKQVLNHMLRFPGHVVFTAHEKNHNEEGGSSELMLPSVTSAISKAVAGWLNGICSYVCQAFIREQMKLEDIGDGSGTMLEKPTGKAEYCLRIGAHPIFWTGFRIPLGLELKQDVIVNPTFDKIMLAIQGKKV
jgi:hypothetical protein